MDYPDCGSLGKDFPELASKKGSRKWWGKAAWQTVPVEREEQELAVVEVLQVGVRLHLKRKKLGKSLG